MLLDMKYYFLQRLTITVVIAKLTTIIMARIPNGQQIPSSPHMPVSIVTATIKETVNKIADIFLNLLITINKYHPCENLSRRHI